MRALYRDFDGTTRPVTRYANSKAAAERELKTALRDRTATAGQDITPDTRIRDTAKLWRSEIENTDHLAEASKTPTPRTLDGLLPLIEIEVIDPEDPNAIDQVADALAEIKQRMADSDG